MDVHSQTSGADVPSDAAARARTPVDAKPHWPTDWPTDPVEAALAVALTKAAEAGRFDFVAQLARELEARRLAGSPNVITISLKASR